MERDLARRKERDHGYEDVVEVCFTCNNTSSGVNLFNAESLPTAYATVPSVPLETHSYALSESSIARWRGRQGQEARASSLPADTSWRHLA